LRQFSNFGVFSGFSSMRTSRLLLQSQTSAAAAVQAVEHSWKDQRSTNESSCFSILRHNEGILASQ